MKPTLTGVAPNPGVKEFLSRGHSYPEYLSAPSCRIANPAQSFQALTVGSVARCEFEDADWKSIVSREDEPSSFSRSGFGMWGAIKPEVVEYGGDFLYTENSPPDVATPDIGRDCYPTTVRSTLFGGPAVGQDKVGTSFAAPKFCVPIHPSLTSDENAVLVSHRPIEFGVITVPPRGPFIGIIKSRWSAVM